MTVAVDQSLQEVSGAVEIPRMPANSFCLARGRLGKAPVDLSEVLVSCRLLGSRCAQENPGPPLSHRVVLKNSTAINTNYEWKSIATKTHPSPCSAVLLYSRIFSLLYARFLAGFIGAGVSRRSTRLKGTKTSGCWDIHFDDMNCFMMRMTSFGCGSSSKT